MASAAWRCGSEPKTHCPARLHRTPVYAGRQRAPSPGPARAAFRMTPALALPPNPPAPPPPRCARRRRLLFGHEGVAVVARRGEVLLDGAGADPAHEVELGARLVVGPGRARAAERLLP